MLVGQKVGPFIIDKELGAGAMGTVYRAFYGKIGKDVAIKIISGPQDANANSVARFEREMKILKELKHPHIVQLIGTGRYKGAPFYVMEFIDGQTLERQLHRKQRFTWEEVVAVGQQLCDALQHAHHKGVIHRDLKPANIMMTKDGIAKLTDFGIAKGVEVTQLTATNCTVGTASYMSPEQCKGERNLTFKSDLYSLGVVFYELLTGRRPFQAENTLDMFLAHTEGKFERPSRLVMDIPIWLDTLVCQLMEKDPEKRPFDAAMVARALTDIQEKVTAQRSAGVDVATARRGDVPRERLKNVNETDRETARLLRATATKKKLKRKQQPIYERGWFVGLAVCCVLLALGGVTWYAFQPPAPASLYLKAKKLMESNDPKVWAEAREGPIQKFLDHYADRTDDQAKQMRAWNDQIALDLRERQLRNRMRLKVTPEGEAESLAYAASLNEEEGDLAAAVDRWQALGKYRDNADSDLHALSLVAAKRLQEIKGAETWEHQLRDRIAEARRFMREVKVPDDSTERRALLALYAEEYFEDFPLALIHWRQVKMACQGDSARRSWLLLAIKKIRDLKPLEAKSHVELVQKKLDEARNEKRIPEARKLCQDIIAVYQSERDPKLVELVKSARDLLKK